MTTTIIEILTGAVAVITAITALIRQIQHSNNPDAHNQQ